MSYVVLARKWRPQSFDDLVGQDHVSTTIGNAIARGRVAHAFLFTGVRGVGKTTSARILAKALNCVHGPTAKPCQQCAPCTEITVGADVDVQEIDGASYNGVDEVRKLQESLPYRPARDRYKIFIVDEVHMLSNAAWNAFLKTLEEPPPHVKFIFATTEVHKVPVTILSRCQRYDFKLLSAQTIAARLRYVLEQEKIPAEDGAVKAIAREAAGSMRDAMSLLDQVIAWVGVSGDRITTEGVARVLGVADREVMHRLAEALVAGDPATCLRIVGDVAQEGYDLPHVARDILSHLRDLVVARVCEDPGPLLDLADAEVADMKALAAKADPDDLARLHQGFSRAFDDIARSGQPRASLEMALVRLARRPPLVPVDELLRRLGELDRRLGGGGSGPSGGQDRAPQRPGGGPSPQGGPPRRSASPAGEARGERSASREGTDGRSAEPPPAAPPAPGPEVPPRVAPAPPPAAAGPEAPARIAPAPPAPPAPPPPPPPPAFAPEPPAAAAPRTAQPAPHTNGAARSSAARPGFPEPTPNSMATRPSFPDLPSNSAAATRPSFPDLPPNSAAARPNAQEAPSSSAARPAFKEPPSSNAARPVFKDPPSNGAPGRPSFPDQPLNGAAVRPNFPEPPPGNGAVRSTFQEAPTLVSGPGPAPTRWTDEVVTLPTLPTSVDVTAWRAVLDLVRRQKPALASFLERAAILELGPERAMLGFFAADSMYFAHASDPAARQLLGTALQTHYGKPVELQIDTLAPGTQAVSMAQLFTAEEKARQAARRRAVAQHPLVAAAIELLGAELKDIQLPPEAHPPR
ncbi:DNA polymerase III subunit gamma/tau [Chondromyces apiculatus]|uniref:DNA-directed DNA polymerase n=1 Tax=Chondromyces apiculatus DSM 436 TaxID=1192034 RepID=A0A017T9X2_9BACT|nr:DNA polymerase III subunit gamma/tau [Chondromyces apiculatus]EYF05610.1 DNA polymerase III subunits gamma and tau [Chondromyces apiculatus DSM 436]